MQTPGRRRFGDSIVRVMNEVLLGKRLSRLGDNSDYLWRRILMKKYRLEDSGWKVTRSTQRACSFWRGGYAIFWVIWKPGFVTELMSVPL